MVVASVSRRVWPPSLDLRSVEGYVLMPSRAGKLVREARERGDEPDDVQFLDENAYELAYELSCRCGWRAVRLVPQIVEAVRRARGGWVTLT